jgi:hypothetical protein
MDEQRSYWSRRGVPHDVYDMTLAFHDLRAHYPQVIGTSTALLHVKFMSVRLAAVWPNIPLYFAVTLYGMRDPQSTHKPPSRIQRPNLELLVSSCSSDAVGIPDSCCKAHGQAYVSARDFASFRFL